MIFVDSNALIAIRNVNHPLHQKALFISRNLAQQRENLITTNIVISEAITILAMSVNKALAIQFGEEINSQRLPIVYIDQRYHQKAWEIFKQVKDKNVSFFDCTSFAVMRDLEIQKAFSFDKDFQTCGFETLS